MRLNNRWFEQELKAKCQANLIQRTDEKNMEQVVPILEADSDGFASSEWKNII